MVGHRCLSPHFPLSLISRKRLLWMLSPTSMCIESFLSSPKFLDNKSIRSREDLIFQALSNCAFITHRPTVWFSINSEAHSSFLCKLSTYCLRSVYTYQVYWRVCTISVSLLLMNIGLLTTLGRGYQHDLAAPHYFSFCALKMSAWMLTRSQSFWKGGAVAKFHHCSDRSLKVILPTGVGWIDHSELHTYHQGCVIKLDVWRGCDTLE